ncbi:diguanylate cyclase domain-containing protein [Gordonibacter massiliensis (ex Traore et al. 2017)]|uniref:diguanylate cyclase domain-containing protein n=1 Tax=Gordonibacter massiliensis (ex Traore et al. 2017) TaxID=1841863 RepID=UPI0034A06273
MRRPSARTVFAVAALSLVVCVLSASMAMFVHSGIYDFRRSEAESVLSLYQQTMTLKLRGDLSEVGDLAVKLEADPDDEAWLAKASSELLARDEVAYVAYVQGETMRAAYPEDAFGDMVGRSINEFSYLYTLAKVTNGFVVEGPIELANGESAFLFVQPIDIDGAYYGEAVMALKADYVIGQLDFASLEDAGYRYELWAVSPQDGSKDVIAASEGERDFSNAVKMSFNMPTLWTLSIMPANGWVPSNWTAALAVGFSALSLLAIGVIVAASRLRRMRRQLEEERRLDPETGLLTYGGFVERLGKEASQGQEPQPLTLVCLMVDDFERTALSLGWDARRRYLQEVGDEIAHVVEGDYFAARVSGAGCFVIALRERVEKRALGDLMRGLELALLWKARIDGKKVFCRVRSAAVRYPEDGADPAALVERMVSLLERDRPEGFERKRRG